jgi:mutual gliding-motility protein MglA
VGAPSHVSLINYSTHEISCKIVYYGPGLGGKTTNIRYVYNRLRPESKGRLISLATDMDRTLFFDFLPLDLGNVKGFRVRFHLYTVPGQVYYDASRKLILRGVDGLVFVVDSLAQRFDANVESMYNLHENLAEHGLALSDIPFALQYNKRDLRDVVALDDLQEELNPTRQPSFEAIASQGVGVFDTLKCVSKQVLQKLA